MSKSFHTDTEIEACMKVALVGCGAVARSYYIPAMLKLPDYNFEWFIDSSLDSARKAQIEYGNGRSGTDYHDAIDDVDAAVVAVPNSLHAAVSIDFLSRRKHVLVEKPIATSTSDAQRMVKTAEDNKVKLRVNLIRRRFENYQAAKSILDEGVLGQVKRIKWSEGHILDWPFKSFAPLRKESAGGGVLMDWGPHVFDAIEWFFGGKVRVLNYADDGLGRIEAECSLKGNIPSEGSEISCEVTLSRIRELPSVVAIDGEKASLIFDHSDSKRLELRVGKRVLLFKNEGAKSMVDCFAEQIVALGNGDPIIADGREALSSLSTIETCYNRAEPLAFTWDVPIPPQTRTPGFSRVLIIGASGFLGTRLAERLTLGCGAQVRVGLRSVEKGSRLAKLPVEFSFCDLMNPNSLEDSLQGCDAVVNCARSGSGNRKQESNFWDTGTRNLMDSAVKQGVKKIVHISTAAVHGFGREPRSIFETSALKLGSSYVNGKIRAEKIVASYGSKLSYVILRPTLIYGPFSRDWVANVIDGLRKRRIAVIGSEGVANLVFVDDVVDSILLSLELPMANNQVFLVNGVEHPTWKEYIGALSAAIGTSPVSLTGSYWSERLKRNGSLFKDSVSDSIRFVRSPETAWLFSRSPAISTMGLRLLGASRGKRIAISLQASTTKQLFSSLPTSSRTEETSKYNMVSRETYDVLRSRFVFSFAKANKILGFRPSVSYLEGLQRTLDWVKWAYPNDDIS